MSPRKKSSETSTNEPSFEKALERLETIVEQMESAELPLDEVLKRYEEGTQLVKFCSQKLEEAEKRVEILSKNKDGSAQLKKFRVEDTDESGDLPEKQTKDGKLL